MEPDAQVIMDAASGWGQRPTQHARGYVAPMYALHDAEATAASAPQWAAHVRLTPELLQKLTRATDAQISIRLNASGVASLGKNKKTSVLTVTAPRSDNSDSSDSSEEEDEALASEQYELLSFPEDPHVNHVCAFRKVPPATEEDASTHGGGGYAIHRAGTIHQKLIVQRLLNSTEKDRMKDRHARSVRESKARSSKLIDAVEGPPDVPSAASKRRRLTVQMKTRPMARIGAKQPVASAQPTTIMRLPSALSPEEAQQTRERIEAGFEQPAPESPAHSVVADAASASDASVASCETDAVPADGPEDTGNADIAEPSLPVVAPAKSKSTSSTTPAKLQRKRAAKDTSAGRAQALPTTVTTEIPADELAADSKDSGVTSNPAAARHSTVKSPTKKRARKETPQVDGIDEYLAAVTVSSDNAPDKKNGDTTTATDAASAGAEELEPSTSTGSAEETKSFASRPTATVKRPLQRSVPMPDLSFFPPVVAEICERVARHKSRSAIIDEADYDAFVEQYEGFQRDWETLDKAYSIEFIRCEGLHLQLELASTLEQRVSLNDKLQASARKKEGLLFVQGTMATMQKLLAGIQASVLRFDRK